MAPNAKRRKIESKAVEEVVFDPAARQDYLTGFHKRKLERAKHAREVAEKKARAEKIEDRKRLREERKADLERHVQEVNALLRPETGATSGSEVENGLGSDEEWGGLEDPPAPVDHEAEYVDEDRYTTVTVEEMDLSREGLHKAELAAAEAVESEDREDAADGNATDKSTRSGKRIWTKDKPANEAKKSKKRKMKFRYESKAERKLTRSKEKLKNSRQAKARRGE